MNILFPVVRYTSVSADLAPFVKNMALMFKANVHVLRVEPLIDQFIEMRVKEAAAWLSEFVGEHLQGCTITQPPVVPGDPAVEILAYIAKNEIDCVVIGTHGRKGLSGVLFGSTTRDIVGKAPVPVLSLNPFLMSKAFKKRNAKYLGMLIDGLGLKS